MKYVYLALFFIICSLTRDFIRKNQDLLADFGDEISESRRDYTIKTNKLFNSFTISTNRKNIHLTYTSRMSKRQSESNDIINKVPKTTTSPSPSTISIPTQMSIIQSNQPTPQSPNPNSSTTQSFGSSYSPQSSTTVTSRKPIFILSKTQEKNLIKFHAKTKEFIESTNFETLHEYKVIKIQGNEDLGSDLLDAVHYLEKEKFISDIDMTHSRVGGTTTNRIFYIAVKDKESISTLKKLNGAYSETLSIDDVGVHFRVLTKVNTMLLGSEIERLLKEKGIPIEGITLSGTTANLYFSTLQDAFNYRFTYPKMDLPGATLVTANWGNMTNSGKVYAIAFYTGKDSIPALVVQEIFATFSLKPLAVFPTEKTTHHVYLSKHDYIVFQKYALPLMTKLRPNLGLRYLDIENRTSKIDKKPTNNNNDDFSDSLFQSNF
jgi:hypothetical protein